MYDGDRLTITVRSEGVRAPRIAPDFPPPTPPSVEGEESPVYDEDGDVQMEGTLRVRVNLQEVALSDHAQSEGDVAVDDQKVTDEKIDDSDESTVEEEKSFFRPPRYSDAPQPGMESFAWIVTEINPDVPPAIKMFPRYLNESPAAQSVEWRWCSWCWALGVRVVCGQHRGASVRARPSNGSSERMIKVNQFHSYNRLSSTLSPNVTTQNSQVDST